MWSTRLVAVVIAVAGTLAAVLLVGMPHFDRGNVFGALTVGVALALLAGGVTGAALEGTSTALALFFVAPLLLWDAAAVASAFAAGLELSAVALWLGQTALLALVFHGAGVAAARVRQHAGKR